MLVDTDRIDKVVFLSAPRERVWAAIADAKRFGSWFGIRFEGEFAVDAHLVGTIVPTEVDPAMAQAMAPHAGLTVDFYIERIEPMNVFVYRWHPFAIDRDVDYSAEETTTVTFALADAPAGTSLKIMEIGFDGLPFERRGPAFEANDEGWFEQTKLLEKYLAHSRA
jgi:uncharacterized protein YndB with AHSA1/START domain